MIPIRKLAFILGLLFAPHSDALADEVFTYVSPTYTLNNNPALFGANMSATVTLSCSGIICGNGTYSGSSLSFKLTSGPASIFQPAKPGNSSFFTLTNGIPSQWWLFDTSDTDGNSPWYDLDLVGNLPDAGDPPYFAAASYWVPPQRGMGSLVVVSNAESSGVGAGWSSGPVGAPLSDIGTGLPSLLLVGGLIFWGWRRQSINPLLPVRYDTHDQNS
jgi:hypothetical protein